jgi:hypothetical protein
VKTHLHSTTFLSGGSDTSSHVLFLSMALSSSSIAVFHFLSSLAIFQHLGKETEFNGAMNVVCTGDMLEYETI